MTKIVIMSMEDYEETKKKIEELEQKIEYYKGAFKLVSSYNFGLKINVDIERFKDVIQKLLDNSEWKDTYILEPQYGWEWTLFDFIVKKEKADNNAEQ